MNVKSQATVTYAYAQGNLKVKSISTSNIVSTEIRMVDLLAKKTANMEAFKPNDVITYHIIINNPGNYSATNVLVTDELIHQTYLKDSFKYLFLDESKTEVKATVKDKEIVFEIDELKPNGVCVLMYQASFDDILDINIDIKNTSNIRSKEVQPFSTNTLNMKQQYAKLEIVKKAVDYTYLNTDISYLITIKNVGNIVANEVEVVDQLPYTFELDKSKEAITVDNQNIDKYQLDKKTNTLKLIIDKVEPNANVLVVVKGKIVK